MTAPAPLTLTERIAARATANLAAMAKNGGSTIQDGMGSTAPDAALAPREEIAADVPDEEFYQGLGAMYDKPAYLLHGIKQLIGKGGRLIKPDVHNVIATDDPYVTGLLEHLLETSGYVIKLPQKVRGT
jgi:hypothetical protein